MALKKAEPWYLGQRAEALAMVLVTRRTDLEIQRQTTGADYGFDLVLEIKHGERRTGRMLRVQLKSQVEPASDGRVPSRFVRNEAGIAISPTVPACVFFFTMRDERAYYYWIAEPTIGDLCDPKLRFTHKPRLEPLDDEALSHIIARVDQWYDALTVSLAA